MQISSPLQKHFAPSGHGSSCLQGQGASLPVIERQRSSDGTRKLLLGLPDGHAIETVVMAMPKSHTLCLSSQVGCPVGCTFCLTGQGGFVRNLSPAELMGQVRTASRELHAETGEWPQRAVFMGMGEPLLNFESVLRCLEALTDPGAPHLSWRKIQVSTVGIPERLEELGRRRLALPAVSLHAPNQDLRDRIMPGARRWPLDDLVRVLRRYPLPGRERITIEYILLRGVNDSDDHAGQLHALLEGVRAKINLIPCNTVPGSPHASPAPERIEGFARRLRNLGLTVFARRSLGPDILAACGQLRGETGHASPQHTCPDPKGQTP